MPFCRLGPSGLRVPLFSFGNWLTIGGSTNAKDLIKTAFEKGITDMRSPAFLGPD
ncbi:hypothetical protein BDZ89DRAFT_1062064 [Hymenopellis radicata]|nr:hypothetical protein BDZ89DRAFT_1062064 [Hymenopellis radicata]